MLHASRSAVFWIKSPLFNKFDFSAKDAAKLTNVVLPADLYGAKTHGTHPRKAFTIDFWASV
jgi:LDH2 family malate/lactate/ureidoglycolate dehydrogenase